MSESVIADFVGQFNSEVSTRSDPIKGRVVLSQKRLVLAASEDDKLTIPLSSVFDVAIGQVPPDLGDFFDSTVTVAFEKNGRRLVAAIEAGDEKIEKFGTLLFKAIVNGTETTVKERARVGGRVTDDAQRTARLFLSPGTVEFRREDGTFAIDLETVSDFSRTTREVSGSKRPVLEVRHMQDGTAVTTMATLASPRKMSILGRYLRREYSELMEEIRSVDLTRDKKEVLVAMYSTGDMEGMPLANILGKDSAAVSMLLRDLDADNLVQDGPDGPTLTPKGKIVASRHLEDVNA
ncbi:CheF family chemotaxis protein [Halomicroarcula limicola]|uniref:Taxis protein CheF n=1 Tax=Haloarcula limicola TaxID=1429915 RepID=A0A8J8C6T2_9EURY|nr:CheF family chemotaxis protein [Halomicroarcula limicola]MBV0924298.1 CheF family chemotaxis protein [Halomicroarcula limicola]